MVKELFINAVDFRNYGLIRNSALYNNTMADDINIITKQAAQQMENRTFNRKDTMPIISFMQYSRATCYACNIQKSTGMWLPSISLTAPSSRWSECLMHHPLKRPGHKEDASRRFPISWTTCWSGRQRTTKSSSPTMIFARLRNNAWRQLTKTKAYGQNR